MNSCALEVLSEPNQNTIESRLPASDSEVTPVASLAQLGHVIHTPATAQLPAIINVGSVPVEWQCIMPL